MTKHGATSPEPDTQQSADETNKQIKTVGEQPAQQAQDTADNVQTRESFAESQITEICGEEGISEREADSHTIKNIEEDAGRETLVAPNVQPEASCNEGSTNSEPIATHSDQTIPIEASTAHTILQTQQPTESDPAQALEASAEKYETQTTLSHTHQPKDTVETTAEEIIGFIEVDTQISTLAKTSKPENECHSESQTEQSKSACLSGASETSMTQLKPQPNHDEPEQQTQRTCEGRITVSNTNLSVPETLLSEHDDILQSQQVCGSQVTSQITNDLSDMPISQETNLIHEEIDESANNDQNQECLKRLFDEVQEKEDEDSDLNWHSHEEKSYHKAQQVKDISNFPQLEFENLRQASQSSNQEENRKEQLISESHSFASEEQRTQYSDEDKDFGAVSEQTVQEKLSDRGEDVHLSQGEVTKTGQEYLAESNEENLSFEVNEATAIPQSCEKKTEAASINTRIKTISPAEQDNVEEIENVNIPSFNGLESPNNKEATTHEHVCKHQTLQVETPLESASVEKVIQTKHEGETRLEDVPETELEKDITKKGQQKDSSYFNESCRVSDNVRSPESKKEESMLDAEREQENNTVERPSSIQTPNYQISDKTNLIPINIAIKLTSQDANLTDSSNPLRAESHEIIQLSSEISEALESAQNSERDGDSLQATRQNNGRDITRSFTFSLPLNEERVASLNLTFSIDYPTFSGNSPNQAQSGDAVLQKYDDEKQETSDGGNSTGHSNDNSTGMKKAKSGYTTEKRVYPDCKGCCLCFASDTDETSLDDNGIHPNCSGCCFCKAENFKYNPSPVYQPHLLGQAEQSSQDLSHDNEGQERRKISDTYDFYKEHISSVSELPGSSQEDFQNSSNISESCNNDVNHPYFTNEFLDNQAQNNNADNSSTSKESIQIEKERLKVLQNPGSVYQETLSDSSPPLINVEATNIGQQSNLFQDKDISLPTASVLDSNVHYHLKANEDNASVLVPDVINNSKAGERTDSVIVSDVKFPTTEDDDTASGPFADEEYHSKTVKDIASAPAADKYHSKPDEGIASVQITDDEYHSKTDKGTVSIPIADEEHHSKPDEDTATAPVTDEEHHSKPDEGTASAPVTDEECHSKPDASAPVSDEEHYSKPDEDTASAPVSDEEHHSKPDEGTLSAPVTDEEHHSKPDENTSSVPVADEKHHSKPDENTASVPVTDEEHHSKPDKDTASAPVTDDECHSKPDKGTASVPVTDEEHHSTPDEDTASVPVPDEEHHSKPDDLASVPVTDEEHHSTPDEDTASVPVTDEEHHSKPDEDTASVPVTDEEHHSKADENTASAPVNNDEHHSKPDEDTASVPVTDEEHHSKADEDSASVPVTDEEHYSKPDADTASAPIKTASAPVTDDECHSKPDKGTASVPVTDVEHRSKPYKGTASAPVTDEECHSKPDEDTASVPVTDEEHHSKPDKGTASVPVTDEEHHSKPDEDTLSVPVTDEEHHSKPDEDTTSVPVTDEEHHSKPDEDTTSVPVTDEEDHSTPDEETASVAVNNDEHHSKPDEDTESVPVTDEEHHSKADENTASAPEHPSKADENTASAPVNNDEHHSKPDEDTASVPVTDEEHHSKPDEDTATAPVTDEEHHSKTDENTASVPVTDEEHHSKADEDTASVPVADGEYHSKPDEDTASVPIADEEHHSKPDEGTATAPVTDEECHSKPDEDTASVPVADGEYHSKPDEDTASVPIADEEHHSKADEDTASVSFTDEEHHSKPDEDTASVPIADEEHHSKADEDTTSVPVADEEQHSKADEDTASVSVTDEEHYSKPDEDTASVPIADEEHHSKADEDTASVPIADGEYHSKPDEDTASVPIAEGEYHSKAGEETEANEVTASCQIIPEKLEPSNDLLQGPSLGDLDLLAKISLQKQVLQDIAEEKSKASVEELTHSTTSLPSIDLDDPAAKSKQSEPFHDPICSEPRRKIPSCDNHEKSNDDASSKADTDSNKSETENVKIAGADPEYDPNDGKESVSRKKKKKKKKSKSRRERSENSERSEVRDIQSKQGTSCQPKKGPGDGEEQQLLAEEKILEVEEEDEDERREFAELEERLIRKELQQRQENEMLKRELEKMRQLAERAREETEGKFKRKKGKKSLPMTGNSTGMNEGLEQRGEDQFGQSKKNLVSENKEEQSLSENIHTVKNQEKMGKSKKNLEEAETEQVKAAMKVQGEMQQQNVQREAQGRRNKKETAPRSLQGQAQTKTNTTTQTENELALAQNRQSQKVTRIFRVIELKETDDTKESQGKEKGGSKNDPSKKRKNEKTEKENVKLPPCIYRKSAYVAKGSKGKGQAKGQKKAKKSGAAKEDEDFEETLRLFQGEMVECGQCKQCEEVKRQRQMVQAYDFLLEENLSSRDLDEMMLMNENDEKLEREIETMKKTVEEKVETEAKKTFLNVKDGEGIVENKKEIEQGLRPKPFESVPTTKVGVAQSKSKTESILVSGSEEKGQGFDKTRKGGGRGQTADEPTDIKSRNKSKPPRRNIEERHEVEVTMIDDSIKDQDKQLLSEGDADNTKGSTDYQSLDVPPRDVDHRGKVVREKSIAEVDEDTKMIKQEGAVCDKSSEISLERIEENVVKPKGETERSDINNDREEEEMQWEPVLVSESEKAFATKEDICPTSAIINATKQNMDDPEKIKNDSDVSTDVAKEATQENKNVKEDFDAASSSDNSSNKSTSRLSKKHKTLSTKKKKMIEAEISKPSCQRDLSLKELVGEGYYFGGDQPKHPVQNQPAAQGNNATAVNPSAALTFTDKVFVSVPSTQESFNTPQSRNSEDVDKLLTTSANTNVVLNNEMSLLGRTGDLMRVPQPVQLMNTAYKSQSQITIDIDAEFQKGSKQLGNSAYNLNNPALTSSSTNPQPLSSSTQSPTSDGSWSAGDSNHDMRVASADAKSVSKNLPAKYYESNFSTGEMATAESLSPERLPELEFINPTMAQLMHFRVVPAEENNANLEALQERFEIPLEWLNSPSAYVQSQLFLVKYRGFRLTWSPAYPVFPASKVSSDIDPQCRYFFNNVKRGRESPCGEEAITHEGITSLRKFNIKKVTNTWANVTKSGDEVVVNACNKDGEDIESKGKQLLSEQQHDLTENYLHPQRKEGAEIREKHPLESHQDSQVDTEGQGEKERVVQLPDSSSTTPTLPPQTKDMTSSSDISSAAISESQTHPPTQASIITPTVPVIDSVTSSTESVNVATQGSNTTVAPKQSTRRKKSRRYKRYKMAYPEDTRQKSPEKSKKVPKSKNTNVNSKNKIETPQDQKDLRNDVESAKLVRNTIGLKTMGTDFTTHTDKGETYDPVNEKEEDKTSIGKVDNDQKGKMTNNETSCTLHRNSESSQKATEHSENKMEGKNCNSTPRLQASAKLEDNIQGSKDIENFDESNANKTSEKRIQSQFIAPSIDNEQVQKEKKVGMRGKKKTKKQLKKEKRMRKTELFAKSQQRKNDSNSVKVRKDDKENKVEVRKLQNVGEEQKENTLPQYIFTDEETKEISLFRELLDANTIPSKLTTREPLKPTKRMNVFLGLLEDFGNVLKDLLISADMHPCMVSYMLTKHLSGDYNGRIPGYNTNGTIPPPNPVGKFETSEPTHQMSPLDKARELKRRDEKWVPVGMNRKINSLFTQQEPVLYEQEDSHDDLVSSNREDDDSSSQNDKLKLPKDRERRTLSVESSESSPNKGNRQVLQERKIEEESQSEHGDRESSDDQANKRPYRSDGNQSKSQPAPRMEARDKITSNDTGKQDFSDDKQGLSSSNKTASQSLTVSKDDATLHLPTTFKVPDIPLKIARPPSTKKSKDTQSDKDASKKSSKEADPSKPEIKESLKNEFDSKNTIKTADILEDKMADKSGEIVAEPYGLTEKKSHNAKEVKNVLKVVKEKLESMTFKSNSESVDLMEMDNLTSNEGAAGARAFGEEDTGVSLFKTKNLGEKVIKKVKRLIPLGSSPSVSVVSFPVAPHNPRSPVLKSSILKMLEQCKFETKVSKALSNENMRVAMIDAVKSSRLEESDSKSHQSAVSEGNDLSEDSEISTISETTPLSGTPNFDLDSSTGAEHATDTAKVNSADDITKVVLSSGSDNSARPTKSTDLSPKINVPEDNLPVTSQEGGVSELSSSVDAPEITPGGEAANVYPELTSTDEIAFETEVKAVELAAHTAEIVPTTTVTDPTSSIGTLEISPTTDTSGIETNSIGGKVALTEDATEIVTAKETVDINPVTDVKDVAPKADTKDVTLAMHTTGFAIDTDTNNVAPATNIDKLECKTDTTAVIFAVDTAGVAHEANTTDVASVTGTNKVILAADKTKDVYEYDTTDVSYAKDKSAVAPGVEKDNAATAARTSIVVPSTDAIDVPAMDRTTVFPDAASVIEGNVASPATDITDLISTTNTALATGTTDVARATVATYATEATNLISSTDTTDVAPASGIAESNPVSSTTDVTPDTDTVDVAPDTYADNVARTAIATEADISGFARRADTADVTPSLDTDNVTPHTDIAGVVSATGFTRASKATFLASSSDTTNVERASDTIYANTASDITDATHTLETVSISYATDINEIVPEADASDVVLGVDTNSVIPAIGIDNVTPTTDETDVAPAAITTSVSNAIQVTEANNSTSSTATAGDALADSTVVLPTTDTTHVSDTIGASLAANRAEVATEADTADDIPETDTAGFGPEIDTYDVAPLTDTTDIAPATATEATNRALSTDATDVTSASDIADSALVSDTNDATPALDVTDVAPEADTTDGTHEKDTSKMSPAIDMNDVAPATGKTSVAPAAVTTVTPVTERTDDELAGDPTDVGPETATANDVIPAISATEVAPESDTTDLAPIRDRDDDTPEANITDITPPIEVSDAISAIGTTVTSVLDTTKVAPASGITDFATTRDSVNVAREANTDVTPPIEVTDVTSPIDTIDVAPEPDTLDFAPTRERGDVTPEANTTDVTSSIYTADDAPESDTIDFGHARVRDDNTPESNTTYITSPVEVYDINSSKDTTDVVPEPDTSDFTPTGNREEVAPEANGNKNESVAGSIANDDLEMEPSLASSPAKNIATDSMSPREKQERSAVTFEESASVESLEPQSPLPSNTWGEECYFTPMSQDSKLNIVSTPSEVFKTPSAPVFSPSKYYTPIGKSLTDEFTSPESDGSIRNSEGTDLLNSSAGLTNTSGLISPQKKPLPPLTQSSPLARLIYNINNCLPRSPDSLPKMGPLPSFSRRMDYFSPLSSPGIHRSIFILFLEALPKVPPFDFLPPLFLNDSHRVIALFSQYQRQTVLWPSNYIRTGSQTLVKRLLTSETGDGGLHLPKNASMKEDMTSHRVGSSDISYDTDELESDKSLKAGDMLYAKDHVAYRKEVSDELNEKFPAGRHPTSQQRPVCTETCEGHTPPGSPAKERTSGHSERETNIPSANFGGARRKTHLLLRRNHSPTATRQYHKRREREGEVDISQYDPLSYENAETDEGENIHDSKLVTDTGKKIHDLNDDTCSISDYLKETQCDAANNPYVSESGANFNTSPGSQSHWTSADLWKYAKYTSQEAIASNIQNMQRLLNNIEKPNSLEQFGKLKEAQSCLDTLTGIAGTMGIAQNDTGSLLLGPSSFGPQCVDDSERTNLQSNATNAANTKAQELDAANVFTKNVKIPSIEQHETDRKVSVVGDKGEKQCHDAAPNAHKISDTYPKGEPALSGSSADGRNEDVDLIKDDRANASASDKSPIKMSDHVPVGKNVFGEPSASGSSTDERNKIDSSIVAREKQLHSETSENVTHDKAPLDSDNFEEKQTAHGSSTDVGNELMDLNVVGSINQRPSSASTADAEEQSASDMINNEAPSDVERTLSGSSTDAENEEVSLERRFASNTSSGALNDVVPSGVDVLRERTVSGASTDARDEAVDQSNVERKKSPVSNKDPDVPNEPSLSSGNLLKQPRSSEVAVSKEGSNDIEVQKWLPETSNRTQRIISDQDRESLSPVSTSSSESDVARQSDIRTKSSTATGAGLAARPDNKACPQAVESSGPRCRFRGLGCQRCNNTGLTPDGIPCEEDDSWSGDSLRFINLRWSYIFILSDCYSYTDDEINSSPSPERGSDGKVYARSYVAVHGTGIACFSCRWMAEKLLKRCQNCHFATYCSKECQKKDYKNHKTVCLNFTKVKEVLNNIPPPIHNMILQGRQKLNITYGLCPDINQVKMNTLRCALVVRIEGPCENTNGSSFAFHINDIELRRARLLFYLPYDELCYLPPQENGIAPPPAPLRTLLTPGTIIAIMYLYWCLFLEETGFRVDDMRNIFILGTPNGNEGKDKGVNKKNGVKQKMMAAEPADAEEIWRHGEDAIIQSNAKRLGELSSSNQSHKPGKVASKEPENKTLGAGVEKSTEGNTHGKTSQNAPLPNDKKKDIDSKGWKSKSEKKVKKGKKSKW
ncbi:LOW QUALITY PROTEIN: trap-like protein (trep) [Plakobranchus ocellatus]|uniref:Trap-like protein (Trep) n=1 Tax=Plakobranchus ocellatus TaxID=259542 RepID=A0AAV4AGK3_9GAST|nr:LOW QUALITY PROTEIN: trap-like protein (trep) [Plakobranchus ocellatus]